MEDNTVEARINRARSEEMDVTVESTDPHIVQVHNQESGTVHTVVPKALHCSCEDHTYRGVICKHMISLMDDDGPAASAMQEAVKEHRADLRSIAQELQEEQDEVLEECGAITDLLDGLNIDQDLAETDEAGMELLQRGVEQNDAAIVPDSEAEDQTPDEVRDEFEEMIADVTGESA